MLSNRFSEIVARFPQEQFRFCFAYGSAVKRQLGYDDRSQAKTMIDCVFCVSDPKQWHQANLQLNADHYSALKYLGSNSIAKYQTNYGARVYFNTLIPWNNGSMIKYGVVSKQDLLDDMLNWSYLYLAGRLHKPFEVLLQSDVDIEIAVQKNLESAVRTSLLLLPEKFTFYELFRTIAELSYKGDFRMIFGENKNKVHNIVASQTNEFHQLYASALGALSHCIHTPTVPDTKLEQNKDPKEMLQHLRQLPVALKQKLIEMQASSDKNCGTVNTERILVQLSSNQLMPVHTRKCIDRIVWKSSVLQSIKNIPTAGLVKSIAYSWKKALKTFS